MTVQMPESTCTLSFSHQKILLSQDNKYINADGLTRNSTRRKRTDRFVGLRRGPLLGCS